MEVAYGKRKSVIVTGSTSGISQGLATAFAAVGCHVMLNGFGDSDGIESLRKGLEKDYSARVLYPAAK